MLPGNSGGLFPPLQRCDSGRLIGFPCPGRSRSPRTQAHALTHRKSPSAKRLMGACGLGWGWVDEYRTFWVNPGAAWEERLQTMEHAETRSLLNESRTTPPPPASQIVIPRLKRVSRTSRVFRLLASSEASVLVGSLGQQNVPPLSKGSARSFQGGLTSPSRSSIRRAVSERRARLATSMCHADALDFQNGIHGRHHQSPMMHLWGDSSLWLVCDTIAA